MPATGPGAIFLRHRTCPTWGRLTLTQSDSTIFTGAVGATAIDLQDTNGAIASGTTMTEATNLTTAVQGYSVDLQGAANTVTKPGDVREHGRGHAG